MISLATLDIAGTTIDEGGAVYRVLAEVVAEHGAAPDDERIRQWMGADKREALAALTGDPDAAEALHARFVERLRATYADTPPTPMPGVPETLAALRARDVRVALTTGFDRRITTALLEIVGWRIGEHLDAVVCAPEVGAGRPAPHMIHRAMELTGVTDAGRVLAAGDTVLDIRAGHAAHAGIVVGVLTGAQGRAELEPERPTYLLSRLDELVPILAP